MTEEILEKYPSLRPEDVEAERALASSVGFVLDQDVNARLDKILVTAGPHA